MIIAAYLLSLLTLILNASLFIHLKPPYSFYFWAFQIAAVVLSPLLVVLGLLGAGLGWLYHAPIAIAAGLLGAGFSAIYIARVTVPQPAFDHAFGKDWETKIPASRKSHMLKRRWNLGWPRTGEPRWERDIPFWTIPCKTAAEGSTDRKLLCDVWQPPEGIPHSGLALVYLHASAWWIFDKDNGTRPFFRHLASQGHVIMDVSYRLCPEVDIFAMLGDVKRAVAWMKANATKYHVNPERVILGGASAGGHLALLAAYAPQHPLLTPSELQDTDLSVRAVLSYYGPADLRACYHHYGQERGIGMPKVEIGLPGAADMKKDFSQTGRLDPLLGGHLHEVPEVYELASPVAHVNACCPPTLLFQGEPDAFVPVDATREMHRNLFECGVPSALIIYPLANHAFDLILPKVSPPAHAALYYLERFLAMMAL